VRELLCTLAPALAALAHVLPLTIAHDVAQGRLDKLLLQILREDYLKTCARRASRENRKDKKGISLPASKGDTEISEVARFLPVH
jgi:hypothetical protein